jgi:hypothetical protein
MHESGGFQFTRAVVLLVANLAGGCTSFTSTHCTVAGSPTNRARLATLLQDYSRREGLQPVPIQHPTYLGGFISIYAHYSDAPRSSVELEAHDAVHTIEARLQEQSRFRRKPTQRFTELDHRLRDLFCRSFGDEVRVSTQTAPP